MDKDGVIVGGTPPFPDDDGDNDDTDKDAYVNEGSAAASPSTLADGNAAALPSLTYALRTIRLGQGKGGGFNAMMTTTTTKTTATGNNTHARNNHINI